MGKKKNKKKKQSKEELSLLEGIDQNIISQYRSIKEDIENFQYQLYQADRKTRKKYEKALRTGKPFDTINTPSIRKRKQITQKLEDDNFFDKVIRIMNEFGPILKLLGRLVSTFILALLSLDTVKRGIRPDTMKKIEQIFFMGMSI